MAVRPLRPLAGLAAVLALSACAQGSAFSGFTPLYATPGVKGGLSAIKVSAPQGRTAFMIRQSLEDDLAVDQQAKPVYRLDFKVQQSRVPRGLRIDNIADRYEVNTTVTYALVNIADRKTLTQGVVRVMVTSDSADQPYAGVAAQADADKRSAEEAAHRIALALGGYFAKPTTARNDNAQTPTSEGVGLRSVSERLGGQDITRDPGEMSATEEPQIGPDGVERIPEGQP